MNAIVTDLLGAIVDLNRPAHVVQWHFVQLSVANLVVIAVTLAACAAVIVLPFPGAARRRRGVR
jgi:hypothetical protein